MMERGEKKGEMEWRLLILDYLFKNGQENNHIRSIAKGIGTSTITATKYLYYYLGLGLINTREYTNHQLFSINEKGIEELKKLKGGN